ncbi:helix-turn-helix domain-containing protein [Streptomyces sp. P9-A2]|uniref:helix-turn-helix domain-containing protein n=1 Tax=Streptomyces sp. P9-A2 TaxID=3072284 RepID=UPI002FC63C54
MADERTTSLGPTGEQVRANVQRLRESAGLTKKQLSDRVGELGRTIPPLGISRIEMGTRRVDADDLVALAVALNAHPAALLLPESVRTGVTAEVTAMGETTSRRAWEWAHGMRPPLPSGDDRGKAWMEWRLRSLPDGWRPMSPEDYAAWDMEQAKADYEHLVKQLTPKDGPEEPRQEGGTDG